MVFIYKIFAQLNDTTNLKAQIGIELRKYSLCWIRSHLMRTFVYHFMRVTLDEKVKYRADLVRAHFPVLLCIATFLRIGQFSFVSHGRSSFVLLLGGEVHGESIHSRQLSLPVGERISVPEDSLPPVDETQRGEDERMEDSYANQDWDQERDVRSSPFCDRLQTACIIN